LYCHSPAVQLGRSVPDKTAFYMLSTGKYLSAEDALAAGLVSKVVKKGEIETIVEQTLNAIEQTSR